MDDRLRRRAREAATGDVGARAGLLVERVRAGLLREDRLRLAGHLGDEGALAAEGRAPLVPPMITITRWVRGLAAPEAPWAREAFARATVASARVTLPCLEGEAASAGRAVVDALEAWIACPCEAHGRGVALAGRPLSRPMGVPGLFASRGRRFGEATLFRASGLPLAPGPANALAGDTAAGAARAMSVEAVRDALRAALVPWALA